tara:strand:+ start:154 stop:282 length:129 start_codon:yes stop_codon:yes gene_type:complete
MGLFILLELLMGHAIGLIKIALIYPGMEARLRPSQLMATMFM